MKRNIFTEYSTYLCAYVHMYVCMCIYTYVCMCVCVCMHECVYVGGCFCVYASACTLKRTITLARILYTIPCQIPLRSDRSFFLLKTVSHVCGLSPVPSSCDIHRPTTYMKQSFATLWQLRDSSSLMCSSTLNYSELNFLYTHVEGKVTLSTH